MEIRNAEAEAARREDLLADADALDRQIDDIDRYLLAGNSWLGWLRSLLNPRRGD